VNRWRQRLVELHGDSGEQPSPPPCTVQNVQNVRNHPRAPVFEHFEQIEQLTELPEALATAADRVLAIWGEVEEERAAIVEHDGGIPRAWAEGFARLDPARPPGEVPLYRWQQFIHDAGWFLDSPFCAVAAALGWGPLDLFGCDRDRPFARTSRAGLLWLLNGNRLVALTENTAAMETGTGARQTYRRKLSEPGRVLAWVLADCGWPSCEPGQRPRPTATAVRYPAAF
jgi:hypothetical protein